MDQKPRSSLNAILKNEPQCYGFLCAGIVYSFVSWPLLNSIFCILLFIYWLIFSKKTFDINSRSTRLMVLFCSLFLVSLAGMLYTSNTAEGASRLQEKSAILIFPLIFGTTSFLHTGLLKKIGGHFVIATLITALCGLLYAGVHLAGTGAINSITGASLLVFPDKYPYIFGLSSLLSIILVTTGLAWMPFRWKWFRPCAILLLSIFIILLGTRLVILCWIPLIVVLLLRSIRGLRRRLTAAVVLLLLVGLPAWFVPSLRHQWRELSDTSAAAVIPLDQDASLGKNWGGRSIRSAIWKCSEGLLRRHLLTGVGTGDIQDSLQQAYEDRKFYFASRYNHYNAHNEYLQMAIGHGVTGVLILVLCIVVPAGTIKAREVQTAQLSFLFLFAAICFTEVILDINKGIIWYSFFNSIFAFVRPENYSTTSKT